MPHESPPTGSTGSADGAGSADTKVGVVEAHGLASCLKVTSTDPGLARASAVHPQHEFTVAARTAGDGVYALSSGSILSLSRDDGKSWTRVSPPGVTFDAQWLAKLGPNAVLAVGYREAWSFAPGQPRPIELELPIHPETEGTAFRKVVRGPDGPYLLLHGSSALTRLSSAEPPSSWKVVRPPIKRIADADSTGEGFAAIGWDDSLRTVVVDFDEHGPSAVALPIHHPERIACERQACAVYAGGHILTRATVGGTWRDHGDLFGALRWFLSKCDARALGHVSKVLPEEDLRDRFRAVGLAFDGTTVAVAATWRDSDVSELAASVLLGPNAVSVIPAGHADVWSPRPGVFWFLGPRIHSVAVR